MADKLSILSDQTTPEILWNEYQSNPYGDAAIEQIKDNIGNAEVQVTSIPSPFAQMHLFETAFGFINESFRTNGASAFDGTTTYHKLVSYCLDMYELMFSFDLLSLDGKITLLSWKIDELDEILASQPSKGLKTFAETLKIFINNYNEDIRFTDNGISEPLSHITLIFYDTTIIGGTSPYTGFFTVSDNLPGGIRKLNGREFFNGNIPLNERDPEFQKFINLFFGTNAPIVMAFPKLYTYIKNNRDLVSDPELVDFMKNINAANPAVLNLKEYTTLSIDNIGLYMLGNTIQYYFKKVDNSIIDQEIIGSDYAIRTRKNLSKPPLALQNGLSRPNWTYIRGVLPDGTIIPEKNNPAFNSRTLPETNHQYPFVVRNDFLSKNLIQLDYDINNEKFWVSGNKDTMSYLLPIKPEYFNFFTIEDLKENFTLKKLKSGGIVATLKIPVKANNGREEIKFERTYLDINPQNIDNEDNGAIIPLKIGMGIYPFFKIKENKYNDCYKIIFYHANSEETSLNLYRESFNKAEITTVHIDNTVVRTRADEGTEYVTNYFELSNISRNQTSGELIFDIEKKITFDFITVKVFANNEQVEGLIIPNMGNEINLMNTPSSLAIDIGTSNSYVAYSIGSNNNPKKFSSFKEKNNSSGLQLVMLHHPDEEFRNKSEYFDFNSRVGQSYVTPQLSEFMPTLIGKDSEYDFPIRTIINQDNDTDPTKIENLSLLSNINIPFAFGKNILREELDNAYSNLKWGTTDPDNTAVRHRLYLFIEQLVFMSRNKLLSEGINPENTNVIWFKPLSMSSQQMNVLENSWQEIYQTYFIKDKQSQNERLTNITESWAPFYSFTKAFGAGEIYMNIDIGGGTTDIILFKDNKPEMTTSFRFAGNSLFDNGLSESTEKDNGFVLKYTPIMEQGFAGDAAKENILNYILESNELMSGDLISYFFTIKEFREKLRLDSEFKLLFLIHTSAIFYHAAQMVKNHSDGQVPGYIGLSGNGAKLLEISNGNNNLNRRKGLSELIGRIFREVFELSDIPKIELQILPNPKDSTALGGIKGLDQISDNPNLDVDNYYLAVGDKSVQFLQDDTKLRRKYKYSKFLDNNDDTLDKVAENVQSFFDFFFDVLWHECQFTSNFAVEKSFNPDKLKEYFADKNKIKTALRSAVNNKINVEQEQELNETLFYYPIRAYLYDFSRILADQSKINEFKG